MEGGALSARGPQGHRATLFRAPWLVSLKSSVALGEEEWYERENMRKRIYEYITKKEEGKSIPDILIVTRTKMTRTPSNETILFSFN